MHTWSIQDLEALFQALSLGKLLDERSKLLYSLQRDGVVVAGTDATNAPVTLETSEADLGGLLQESLFGLINIASLMSSG